MRNFSALIIRSVIHRSISKSALAFACLMLVVLGVQAQPSMYKSAYPPTTGTSATGQFGTTVRKAQGIYIPGDLTDATAGTITKIYFQYGTGGPLQVTDLNINLGQTASTAFTPSTTFFTGLTNVFSQTGSNQLPTTGLSIGQWIEFTLATPFAFDPSQTLIYETTNTASSGTNVQTLNTSQSGRKLYTGTLANPTGTATTSWTNIGFYVVPSLADDVSLTAVVVPTPIPTGNVPVQVAIKNFGSATLNDVTINWTVNGNVQTPVTFNSLGLAPYASDTQTLGSYNFATLGYDTIIAIASSPNGQLDLRASNDTARIYTKTCDGLINNYTINSLIPTGGSNFQTFTDMADFLNSCGVSGPVTISVSNGPYNEPGPIVFGNISGSGAANPIYIDGNNRDLNYAGIQTARDVITFNDPNARYITIDNLNINATGTVYGWGIHMMNDANNNTITGCDITISAAHHQASNSAGIVLNGSATTFDSGDDQVSNNTISDNTITGGFTGIVISGGSASGLSGTSISSNTITDFGHQGIYIEETSGAQIFGNNISRPTTTKDSVVVGIKFDGDNINMDVYENRIHNLKGGTPASTTTIYGMYYTSNNVGTAGDINYIYNNFIYNLKNAGSIYGIYESISTFTEFYYNTIVIEGSTTTVAANVGRGFNHASTATTTEFRNNIIYVDRTGPGVRTGVYYEATASTPYSDNNVIYVPGGSPTGQIGNFGGGVSGPQYTLAGWQTISNDDLASTDINPAFADIANADFTPTEALASNIGIPVATISGDFFGTPRNAANPDPGAIEWTPVGTDAALSWVSPAPGITAPGPVSITVNIVNSSSSTINTINITYTDGTTPVSQTFSPGLTAGNNTNLTFTTPFTSGSFASLRAYINTVNGSSDDQQANDTTSSVMLCQPIPAGSYSINKTLPNSPTNFNSFNALADRLATCGVSGAVTVTVASGTGPYVEQVAFPAIAGVGPSARVTIDGNGEVLEFTTNAAARHILRLEGAQFFTIRNLTVRMGTGNPQYCYAIHLTGAASNNIIENNTVDMQTNTGSGAASFYHGIIASESATSINSSKAHNVAITGNTVLGGTTVGNSIRLEGESTAIPSTDIVITGNTITNYRSRALHLYDTNGMIVADNIISSTTNNSGAMYLWNTHTNITVESNIITNNTTAAWEGLYLNNILGANSRISNNLIHIIGTGDATAAGIRVQGAQSGTKVYHNTIVIDNQTSAAGDAFGIWENNSAHTTGDYKNNLFYITRAGSGTKAAFSLVNASDPVTNFTSNGNAFYIPGGYIVNHKTTPATNYATLAAWQAATSNTQDMNSVQANPNFDPGTAIPRSGLINNKGVTGTGVTDDIDDVVRGANPDPGAYEFVPPPNDAAILNHVAACGSPMNVTFVLGNAGTATLTSVTINWTVNGTPQTPYSWTGSLISGASANVTVGTASVPSNASSDFTAFTTSPNGGIDGNPDNDTLEVISYRMGLSGAYTINKSIAASGTNFTSFTSFADTLAARGVCGPVVATVSAGPYDEQAVFSAANGASAVNTITIDGNGQILQATPPDDDHLHILQFNGAAFYTVEDLTVRSTSSTMGWGIQVTNNSNNITLRDNKVELPDSTTGTLNADFMGIYVGSIADDFTGSACDNIKIQNNEVTGGYRGIAVLGTNTVHGQKVTIEGNRVSQFYFKGILVEDMDSASVFNNTVTRPTRGGTGSSDMITMSSGCVNFRVYNNVIANVSASVTSGTFRGLYVTGASTTPSTGQVYNNLVYGIATAGGSTQNGIEDVATGTSSVSFWYNTIVLDGTVASGAGTTNGVLLNPSSGGGTHVYRNNIFYVARQGTGTKTVFNSNLATTTFTSNNNVLYIAPGTPGTLQYGRHSSSNIYPTFVDWQNSGRDVNGVSADPMFVNPASNLNPTNTAIANIGFPVTAQVDVDITGADRSNTTPDPGAYEFCGTGEWNGSVDNDWFTAGNWCASTIPTSATNVVIPNVSTGSNTYPVVEGPGTAVAGNITIHAGASINLTAPGGNMPTLEIYGNVSNSGTANLGTGNLTFRGTTQSLTGPLQINGIVSVLTGSTLNTNDNLTIESGGQLLHGVGTTGGGGIVNGNIKIKRNGWGSSTRWNYWGSPVEGAQTNILGTRTHYYDPTSATDPNTTAGLRAGWKTYSGTMAPGVGYISQNGGAVTFNGPVDDLNANITLTAPINAGVVPYNLIGNPFPSAMDAMAFMDENGPDGSGVITGSMWFWDDDGTGGSGYTKSDFAAWNSTGGVAAGPNTSRTPNGHIATGQGFNVEKTTTGPGVVEFNNTMRSSTNNVYFRQKPIERLWVNVTNTHGLYNEVLIGFIDEATDGYDSKYDTKKMRGNENIALYTKLGGKDYMIQAYSPLTNGGKVVELGIDVGLTGTHTLSLKTMENMDETVVPMLEDRLTGTWQNLRMNPSYSFNVTARGSIVERFYIHFNAPLEITATDASCAGDDAQIVMNQVGGTLWNYLVVDPQGNLVATDNGFTGSIAFNDLESGDYTIMLSDRDGYQFTKHITIDGKQMVTADFEASNIAFVNEEITFTNHSNGAAAYDWDFGDGTVLTGVQNPTHTYTEPGTYTVMLRASNADCYHNRYSTIEVSKLSTGIGNLTEDGYNVYSYGKKIFVNLNLDGEKVRLQVFDLVGKEVYGNHIAAKGNYQVDLSSYPDDAYFVIIRTASETYPVKVMLSGN